MNEFEFVKSSYSGGDAGQECVQVARDISGTVAFRACKDADGPIVRLSPSAWASFAVYAGRARV